jgi:hypothetical protein
MSQLLIQRSPAMKNDEKHNTTNWKRVWFFRGNFQLEHFVYKSMRTFQMKMIFFGEKATAVIGLHRKCAKFRQFPIFIHFVY